MEKGALGDWQMTAEKKFTGEIPGFTGKYI